MRRSTVASARAPRRSTSWAALALVDTLDHAPQDIVEFVRRRPGCGDHLEALFSADAEAAPLPYALRLEDLEVVAHGRDGGAEGLLDRVAVKLLRG